MTHPIELTPEQIALERLNAALARAHPNHKTMCVLVDDLRQALSICRETGEAVAVANWRKCLADRDKQLRDLRNQLVPFEQFKADFAAELVKQFGQAKDREGEDVHEYGLNAAEGYYDDPDCWEDGKIDAAYCADLDLQYWEG